MSERTTGLQQLSRWFDSRPKRERVLIAAALLALLVFMADRGLMTPLQARLDQAQQQESALATQVQALSLEEQQLRDGLSLPTEIALDQARQRVRPLLQRVDELQATMLSSSRMQDFLSGLIPSGSSLRIVAMKTLPVQDIAPVPLPVAASGAPAAPQAQGVYRHGIEIQLEGSYLDLMDYVQRIEQAPWRLVLDGLSVETQQYPRTVLTLRLSTFSLEPQWMRLGS